MLLEEYKKEIASLLWRVPKMNFEVVNSLLNLMNEEMLAFDFLRSLKENEERLPKTVSNEVVRLALKVYASNK